MSKRVDEVEEIIKKASINAVGIELVHGLDSEIAQAIVDNEKEMLMPLVDALKGCLTLLQILPKEIQVNGGSTTISWDEVTEQAENAIKQVVERLEKEG